MWWRHCFLRRIGGSWGLWGRGSLQHTQRLWAPSSRSLGQKAPAQCGLLPSTQRRDCSLMATGRKGQRSSGCGQKATSHRILRHLHPGLGRKRAQHLPEASPGQGAQSIRHPVCAYHPDNFLHSAPAPPGSPPLLPGSEGAGCLGGQRPCDTGTQEDWGRVC